MEQMDGADRVLWSWSDHELILGDSPSKMVPSATGDKGTTDLKTMEEFKEMMAWRKRA